MRDVSAFPVHIEQHDESAPKNQRHPDIDFFDTNCRRRWIDVSIVTPWARTWPAEIHAGLSGTLAASTENIKGRKYQHLLLIPAIWENLGRVGAGVQSLVRGLHATEEAVKRSVAINRTWQNLSVCSQRQNFAMLAAAGQLIPGIAC